MNIYSMAVIQLPDSMRPSDSLVKERNANYQDEELSLILKDNLSRNEYKK